MLAATLLALCLLLVAGCALPAVSPSPSVSATPPPTPVVSTTPTTTFTYVAIGASDSYGVGTKKPSTDNWPAVLARRMGSAVHLLNLGIPGATAALALRDEAPIAVDARPDVITIWLGVNDLDGNVPLVRFTADLRAQLDLLSRQTYARIFVGNLPDLTLVPYFAARYDSDVLSAKVAEWNTAIAQVAAAAHVQVVDIHAQWGELALHPEYISEDGLHPSTVGAERLAFVFARAITAAGACPSPCLGTPAP